MSTDRQMPSAGSYRGVKIQGLQPLDRIEAVVKPAIDAVYSMTDSVHLTDYAADAGNPPEGRLFAAARLEALWQLAAEGRAIRPLIDLERVRASTAGLDSLHWIHPTRYGALFDVHRGVERERPLTDEDLRP